MATLQELEQAVNEARGSLSRNWTRDNEQDDRLTAIDNLLVGLSGEVDALKNNGLPESEFVQQLNAKLNEFADAIEATHEANASAAETISEIVEDRGACKRDIEELQAGLRDIDIPEVPEVGELVNLVMQQIGDIPEEANLTPVWDAINRNTADIAKKNDGVFTPLNVKTIELRDIDLTKIRGFCQ